MKNLFFGASLPLACLLVSPAFAEAPTVVKSLPTMTPSAVTPEAAAAANASDEQVDPVAKVNSTLAKNAHLSPAKTKHAPSSSFGSSSTIRGPADRSHSHMVQLFWKKQEIYDRVHHTLTLVGGARTVRNGITTDADTIIAYMRPKAKTVSAKKSSNDDGSNLELYRVEAVGNVHIFNKRDQAWGDHGLYDLDKGVMLLTGQMPHVLTQKYYITARNLIEYYPDSHISIARGDATVTSTSNKRISADILEGVEAPTVAGQPKKTKSDGSEEKQLDRAYGWGHVTIRNPTQTAIGDRGVYRFGPELARLVGHVRVTQGQNQNNGSQALVNMKTGVSTMLPGGDDAPVQGLVVPNEAN